MVRGGIQLDPEAPVGSRHVTLRLRYQACTVEKCLPPRVADLPLDFRVVAAGTQTRRLHPDLFPAQRP